MCVSARIVDYSSHAVMLKPLIVKQLLPEANNKLSLRMYISNKLINLILCVKKFFFCFIHYTIVKIGIHMLKLDLIEIWTIEGGITSANAFLIHRQIVYSFSYRIRRCLFRSGFFSWNLLCYFQWWEVHLALIRYKLFSPKASCDTVVTFLVTIFYWVKYLFLDLFASRKKEKEKPIKTICHLSGYIYFCDNV